MFLLAIDTSTSSGVGALYAEGRIIGPIGTNIHTTHSEGLMPMIDRLFQESHILPNQLTAVACVNGPGSYTGLRIGLATAQGFATPKQLPCVAISSLELLAQSVLDTAIPSIESVQSTTVCTILPARRGWVYAQFFNSTSQKMLPVSEEYNLKIEDLIAKITQPVLFVGIGVEPYRDMLQAILDENFLEYQPDPAGRGNAMIHLAIAKIQHQETLPPAQLLPHYLGQSQAEINWKNRHPQDS
jgi:tRNA threonylcarbamoyladenosine biosynthesis protein TsaB